MRKLIINHGPCPECPSSDAYSEWDTGHGHCFSCNYHKFNKEPDFLQDNFTYEYVPLRGINRKTLEFYDVRTKVDPEGKPVSIGFRYPTGALKIRSLDKKEFRWDPPGDTSKVGLFGRDKFAAGSHKYVTITEGEIDALSLYQVLGSPVVSVHSSTTAARDVTVDRSWLNSHERIYLAFDADGAGRDALREVAKLFDYNKILVVNFDRRKDANEYLDADEVNELRNIWWNAERYLPDTVISINRHSATEILNETIGVGVAYPFKTWNQMTYGIRKGEVVLLTAQEGVGKTEVMHAVEYQLLKETDDAIGAIFLEEPKRRHLQAIAGLELGRPAHLPDCGSTDAEIVDAVQRAVKTDDRLHVYSHFGSDDPEVLLDTIRFMVSARHVGYILLDHVSMVVSGLAGEDERRALDYISTRLAMMVKELNFALIMVSHVNDNGQTRGSRYVSKIADIRIDLTRDVLSVDVLERNTTYVTISKNRFSGRTGPAGKLIFDPFLYKYTEANNDNSP